MAQGFEQYRTGSYGGLNPGVNDTYQSGDPLNQNDPTGTSQHQEAFTQQNPYSSGDPRLSYGGFDYGQQHYQQLYQNEAANSYNRQAPTLDYNASGANQDYAQYQQLHGQQAGLAGALSQMASGNGTSAADYGMRQQAGASIAQQMGAAGSARGPNQGAAMYGAMQGAAQQGMGLTGQYGQQKAQESWNAQHGLSETLNSMSRGDLQQRGLGQQQAQFGAQLGLQQEGLNQNRELAYTNMEQTMNAQQLNAYQAWQQAQAGSDLQRQLQQKQANAQLAAGAIGAGGAAAGSLAAAALFA